MDINPESTPHQRQSSVEKVAFLATEFGFLSVLGFLGGAAWVGVAVPAILVEIYCGSHPRSLATLMPAGLWLVFYRFTGNLELFFPYAMYVAAFVISRIWDKSPTVAATAGLASGCLFLSIRWFQDATTSVLLVEGAVAVGIVLATSMFCWNGLNRGWMQCIGLIAVSLLAYAGLAL